LLGVTTLSGSTFSSFADNHPTIALYRSVGFKEVGRRNDLIIAPTKERFMQRILAIGGFSTGESEAIAAGYIRKLAGKQTPSICLLSTPAGDPPLLIRNFEETYGRFGFKTSNVSFFSQATTNTVKPEVAAAHLLKQDAIFVSGGNARCAVALWTEWGITAALKEAWNRGILLSGMSA
jgi:peptidase E